MSWVEDASLRELLRPNCEVNLESTSMAPLVTAAITRSSQGRDRPRSGCDTVRVSRLSHPRLTRTQKRVHEAAGRRRQSSDLSQRGCQPVAKQLSGYGNRVASNQRVTRLR
jgi:hypothetical protein